MTPDIPLEIDGRQDSRGLWQRFGVQLPRVLKFDGRAAPDQEATVAAGTIMRLVPLPHRETSDDPLQWPGASIVGTREPDIYPYLSTDDRVSLVQYPNSSITQPQSESHIRTHLLRAAGLQFAPWHLTMVAGWKLEGLAAYLYRLAQGGSEGALSVAERRAACALRQTSLATGTSAFTPAQPIESVGGIFLGRALIDVATALEQLTSAVSPHLSPFEIGKTERFRRLLVQVLEKYVGFVEKAASPKHLSSRKGKITGAIKAAKAFLYLASMFTQSDGTLGQRAECALRVARPAKANVANGQDEISAMLDSLENRLSNLARDGQLPNWRLKYRIGLKCLGLHCRFDRLRANQTIRTDLIYKLIVTRRLDQLYKVLPWMASLSHAFNGVWGGPLGAMAQMFEAARTYEIARELMRRLYDPNDLCRLDVVKGRSAYRNPSTLATQVNNGTRAGFRLADHGLSHHVAKAWLAGRHFHRLYPIAAAARGRLAWSIKTGIADTQTAMTVISVENSKRIYSMQTYDQDLPTYAGLTLIDLVGKHTVQTFRADLRGRRFSEHFARVVEADDKILNRVAPQDAIDPLNNATRELIRSIMKSLDVTTPSNSDSWRQNDPTFEDVRDRELCRFEDLLERNVTSKADANGGAIRRTASDHEKATGSPTGSIWDLVNKARIWTKSATIEKPGPDDAPLERLLEGSDNLPGLTPIAHQPIYVLWFKPDIDRHLLGWISVGAPVKSPVGIIEPCRAELIAGWVNAVRSRAAPLYAKAQVDSRIIDVAIVQFTGFSSIMSDDAHLRL